MLQPLAARPSNPPGPTQSHPSVVSFTGQSGKHLQISNTSHAVSTPFRRSQLSNKNTMHSNSSQAISGILCDCGQQHASQRHINRAAVLFGKHVRSISPNPFHQYSQSRASTATNALSATVRTGAAARGAHNSQSRRHAGLIRSFTRIGETNAVGA